LKKHFSLFFLTESLAIDRDRKKAKLKCSRVLAWTFACLVFIGLRQIPQ